MMKEKLKTTKRTPIQTTQYKNTDSTGYYFPVNDDKPRPKYESYTTSPYYADDSFYKLKMHCLKTYDSLCFEKKTEMKALVEKCEIITIKNRGVKPESCKDVLSVYCYIYYSKDTFTCFAADYDPYIPGGKYAKSSGTTESTKRVSINIVTDAPTTKRTLSSRKEFITPIATTTTKETAKPVITTTKTTTKPVTTTTHKPIVKNDSPFDVGSPLTVSFFVLIVIQKSLHQ